MTPAIHDLRLVLMAASHRTRCELFMAIQLRRSHLKAHLHLTPQAKANKTLIYFTARRYPVGIEDRGDIVSIYWAQHPETSVRVEVGLSAGEVEENLGNFLEARPHDPRRADRLDAIWR